MDGTVTATQGKKRFPEYDIAKGIGVILVAIGHSPGLPFGGLLWIHSFHVPLYFFISGLFVKDQDSVPFFTSLKKNIKGLLLPYFIFSFLFLLVDILFPDIYTDPRGELKFILTGQGSYGALWFFWVLFFERLILDILKRLIKHKAVLFVIYAGMTSAGLILHYCGFNSFKTASVLYASGFYFLGFLLKNNSRFLSVLSEKKTFLFPLFLAADILGTLLLWKLTGTTLDLNSATAFDVALNYATALCGIFFVLNLSVLLKKTPVGTVFSYVGKNSLFFYPLLGGYIPFKIESYTMSQTIGTQVFCWITAAAAAIAVSEIANRLRKAKHEKRS